MLRQAVATHRQARCGHLSSEVVRLHRKEAELMLPCNEGSHTACAEGHLKEAHHQLTAWLRLTGQAGDLTLQDAATADQAAPVRRQLTTQWCIQYTCAWQVGHGIAVLGQISNNTGVGSHV
jgi:hypothetical protein